MMGTANATNPISMKGWSSVISFHPPHAARQVGRDAALKGFVRVNLTKIDPEIVTELAKVLLVGIEMLQIGLLQPHGINEQLFLILQRKQRNSHFQIVTQLINLIAYLIEETGSGQITEAAAEEASEDAAEETSPLNTASSTSPASSS